MAVVPAAPVRQYSFTDHSTYTPTAPQPGDKLDAEIDRTNAALAALKAWAQATLADDGSLKPSLFPEYLVPSALGNSLILAANTAAARALLEVVLPSVFGAQLAQTANATAARTLLGVVDAGAAVGEYNVKTYGAVGSGAVNDAPGIQATINAMPASGGTLITPPGTYRLDANVTDGGKPINYATAPGAHFTGTGRMPLAFSNTWHEYSAWGAVTYPGANDAAAGYGYSTLTCEVIPDATFVGNACAAYLGARASAGSGFVWGLNTMAELLSTFNGNGVSLEVDLNNYGTHPYRGQGVLVTGVGNSQCEVGVVIQRGDAASRWGVGLRVKWAEIGIDVDLSNVGSYAQYGIHVRGIPRNLVKLQPSTDLTPTDAVLFVSDAGDTKSNFSITKRGGVVIGPLGTEISRHYSFQTTLDSPLGSMAAGTVADGYITNADIVMGDTVVVHPLGQLAVGCVYCVFVNAGYVTIRIANLSGGATDPDGGGLAWRVAIWKH